MSEYSPGGFIGGSGTPAIVRMERVEDCPNGHPLWRIGGGQPEHIIGRGDDVEAILACQRALEAAQYGGRS